MKKTVIIEILLLFIFAVSLCSAIFFLYYAAANYASLKEFNEIEIEIIARRELIYGIFLLIAAIANIAVMALVATRDIPKLKHAIENRKNAHKTARKQKQIAELEKKLDELKKDDV